MPIRNMRCNVTRCTFESRRRWHATPLCVMLLLALVLAGVGPLLAQIDRGTIEVLATDPSGAVVPNASIEAVQVQTNTTLQFTSNSEGLYTAPNLPMGSYRLVVKKEGFGTLVREPVEVRPSVKVRVDFALKPGGVSES